MTTAHKIVIIADKTEGNGAIYANNIDVLRNCNLSLLL